MSDLQLTVTPPSKGPVVDPDIAAAARISPATWALIVTLISTIVGWGLTTLANVRTNEQQDAVIAKKQDAEDSDRQYQAIMERLSELHKDVREVRRSQLEGAPRHTAPTNDP